MAADNKLRDEQDLERYGVWVKAGPDERADQIGTSLELMDIEDSDSDPMLITEEEEKLLGELEESALPDFGDFDEFEESIETDFSDNGFDSIGLDTGDFDSFDSDDESKQLLQKIEGELSALRNEIRQLKDELSGLKVPSVSPAAETGEPGGFFDDEDDETIALTGDELDNILDSAEMTEESGVEAEQIAAPARADDGIELDDEEFIDLSSDVADLSEIEEFEVDAAPIEDDPALSILGSPDEPDLVGDPETIEIDIPGLDEVVDLGGDEIKGEEVDDDSIVSIDDISEFEDVTDLDEFGLGEDSTAEVPSLDDIPIESIEEPLEDFIITEDLDDDEDSFDEGEEVEIDLSEVGDDLEVIDDSEILDIEMEDISLDDFGVSDESEELLSATEDETDVLAIDEEIELSTEDFDEEPEIEEIDELEEVLAETIDDAVVFEDVEDIEVEDIAELAVEESPGEPLVIEEIDLSEDKPGIDDVEDIEIEEIDFSGDDDDIEVLEEIDFESDEDVSEISEIEIEGDVDSVEIPEIEIDDAIEEIETVEEFSIDDIEGVDEIEDLEVGLEDEDEIAVTLPDDDFNELPGTEEVDLDSLEALAAAPDLSEEIADDVVDLPELETDFSEPLEIDEVDEIEILQDDDDAADIPLEVEDVPLTPDFEKTELAEISDVAEELSAASLEIGSLPTDLKDEIKDVLKYMDQLLESLPDDKIQEFARSEHFEVYKKIFEELGISD